MSNETWLEWRDPNDIELKFGSVYWVQTTLQGIRMLSTGLAWGPHQIECGPGLWVKDPRLPGPSGETFKIAGPIPEPTMRDNTRIDWDRPLFIDKVSAIDALNLEPYPPSFNPDIPHIDWDEITTIESTPYTEPNVFYSMWNEGKDND